MIAAIDWKPTQLSYYADHLYTVGLDQQRLSQYLQYTISVPSAAVKFSQNTYNIPKSHSVFDLSLHSKPLGYSIVENVILISDCGTPPALYFFTYNRVLARC